MFDFSVIHIFFIYFYFFFFNDPATTEIYTLSLHDALPICLITASTRSIDCSTLDTRPKASAAAMNPRSEEHTSELQSRRDLVCRLLLEKKKKKKKQQKKKKKHKKTSTKIRHKHINNAYSNK